MAGHGRFSKKDCRPWSASKYVCILKCDSAGRCITMSMVMSNDEGVNDFNITLMMMMKIA